MVTHSTFIRQRFIECFLRPALDYGHEQGTLSPCLPGAYVLGRETDNKQLICIIISDSDECYADSKRIKSKKCMCVCTCGL